MLAWFSWLAELKILLILAGRKRAFFSEAGAAAATGTFMNREFKSLFLMNNGGNFERSWAKRSVRCS